jgi:hypothetical protein
LDSDIDRKNIHPILVECGYLHGLIGNIRGTTRFLNSGREGRQQERKGQKYTRRIMQQFDDSTSKFKIT